MKMKAKVSALILCLVLTVSLMSFGCGGDHGKVVRMEIGEKPTKMEYQTGDLFDPTGLVLNVAYEDGYAEHVTEGYTWDITDPLEEDDDEITVRYKNKSILIFIDVILRVPQTLEVATPPEKLTYTAGEKFDKTGLTLKATYEDGSEETVTGGFRVSPSGRLTRATTSVKITYNRKSITIPVTVNSALAQKLNILTQPTKLTYKEGEQFDPTGLTMSVSYSDGTTVDVAAYDYSPKGGLTKDVKKVTISCEGLTAEIPITVEEVPLRIAVTANPQKIVYEEGENFDPAGMVVTKYENGAATVLNESEYTVLDGDNLVVGSTVRVKLAGSGDEITALVPVSVRKTVNATKEMILDAAGNVIGDANNAGTNAVLKGLSVGNDYLGNFVQGDRLTVTFESTSALKAMISIRAASTWTEKYSAINQYYPMIVNDMVANNVFEVYVNGKKVSIGDDVLIFGGSTSDPAGNVAMFAQYSRIELANVDLIQGPNKLELVFLQQTYKNAAFGSNREENEGTQLASITMDTVLINAGAVLHDHDWGEETVAHEATCVSTGKKEQTCSICGAVKPIAIPKTPHPYGETITVAPTCAANGEEYQICSYCGKKNVLATIPKLTTHELTQVTVTEAEDGTQTMARSCACGEHTEDGVVADVVTDLKAEHLKGTNTIAWAAGDYATRTTAILRNSGSATVQAALNVSTGKDFITQLYGGSRIEVETGVTKQTTGSAVFKVSSGWINNASWANSKAKTGDMQFNKVFKVYLRHTDGTETAIPVGDDVILKGATGNYAIMANWNYVVLPDLTMNVGDVLVFESLTPKDDQGRYLYWDGSTAPQEKADGSVSRDNTQSSPNADTVAFFFDK